MNDDLAIETHELTKRYGKTSVVNQLNLCVPKQQITAFLGRNGAGKSTTIKMLLGITSSSAGTGSVLCKTIAMRGKIARCAATSPTSPKISNSTPT